jgi:hypothetical protein
MEEHTQSLRLAQLREIQRQAYELFAKKNRDYGDAFATYGTVGVLVRLQDKLHRAMSVSKQGVHIVQDETLRDTLIDLHNYAAMALMLMDE